MDPLRCLDQRPISGSKLFSPHPLTPPPTSPGSPPTLRVDCAPLALRAAFGCLSHFVRLRVFCVLIRFAHPPGSFQSSVSLRSAPWPIPSPLFFRIPSSASHQRLKTPLLATIRFSSRPQDHLPPSGFRVFCVFRGQSVPALFPNPFINVLSAVKTLRFTLRSSQSEGWAAKPLVPTSISALPSVARRAKDEFPPAFFHASAWPSAIHTSPRFASPTVAFQEPWVNPRE